MAKAELRKPKPKSNPLKAADITVIDYKDVALLRKFISDRGKIRARRVTGVTVQEQRKIAQAIKNGPVKHSGGSLDTGAVFAYDKVNRSVVMPAEMWRELTLLGHWILDAVIVRWAALTERFADAVVPIPATCCRSCWPGRPRSA